VLGIILVSFYHLWLGICLLSLPVIPHPFGQIDPFISPNGAGLSDYQVGWMLVIVASMALIGLFLGRVWYIKPPTIRFIRRVILISPQQFLITYAAYQGLLGVMDAIRQYGLDNEYTSRLIFALNVSLLFAIIHLIGSIQWWASAPKWKSWECTKGPNPCPYRIAEQVRQKVETNGR
jgi:hypothetical protein